MKKQLFLGLLFGWASMATAMTPQEALSQLMDGNQRYASGNMTHPDRNKEARQATVNLQTPFAAILSCSDSRVPLEIVFDSGIGDIFAVRNAGNVTSEIERDSLEFAVQVLGAPLIMVLGHQNCGAVNAVMTGQADAMPAVAAAIAPGIVGDTDLTKAVKDNVMHVMQQLNQNPIVSKQVSDGKVMVVGGYYDLLTGKVELLQQPSTSNNGPAATSRL